VQEKELQVAKKRVGRHPNEFRRMAERLKSFENIVVLSEELGVHRRLYKWRDQLDLVEPREESPAEPHANLHSARRSTS
jgi:hypothetical protein